MRNRTRTSTLDGFGLRDQRDRIYPALQASDGRTLDLDFITMNAAGLSNAGVTFQRASTATFINSSGLVQYADHNLVQNSTMLVGTGWTASTSGGGTVTINNDGTVTFASTNGRATWLRTVGSLDSGLRMTFSIEVTALSNTNIRVSDLFQAGTGFTSQIYNYTDSVGNTTANIGQFATLPGTGLYTVNAVTTATSGNVIFGTDCNGVTRTGSVTIARPQLQYGTHVSSRVYLANSSTTAANTSTPRFDYNPTTLAARGLLIESSATNLLNWSESFATSGGTNNNWGDTNITRTSTNNTDPAGGTTALRITASAGNGTIISSSAIGTSAARTFSVWLRRVTGTGDIQYTQNNGTNYTTQAITSSWVRYTFTHTANHQVGIRIVTSGDAIELWGAQLETGSGASSYIPTAASQATRAADVASITGTNFSSWYQSATAFSGVLEGQAQVSNNYGRVLNFSSGANIVGTSPNFNLGIAFSSSNRPFINAYVASANNIDVYVPVGGAITDGVPFKIGFRHQTSSHYATRGSGLSVTSAYAGFAAGLANLYLAGTDGSYHRSVHFSRLIFWPASLTNAQLDVLAT